MEQAEKRKYLIKTLLAEQPRYRDIEIPEETGEQKRLLRSLFNVRMPGKINEDFLRYQDEYLQESIKKKALRILMICSLYKMASISGREISRHFAVMRS